MKKAFLLFVLFAAMVSCGKGDEPKPDPTPNPPSQNDPNDPDDPDNPNDPEKPNESVNISLSTSSLSFYSYGGALATMITCPEGKTWTLSGGESWCVPNWTSGPNGAFLVFTIEDYTGTEDRNATYTFTCDGQTATLKVTQQAGKTISIHVATEGSLQSILKEQAWNIFGNDNISLLDIRNLKITGNVNDDDCRTIASMFYLRNLDISETTLTEVNALSGAKFKNIILPKNLKKIRRGAFENSALQAIEIPANVETIEDAVFAWCSALTNVTFEQGSQLKTIGEEDFTGRGGAFCACSSLTSIEIPASVKYISSQTFYSSTALTTVDFESGSKLVEIDAFAFSLSGLQSIEIPRSVETIRIGAFEECTDLAIVTFEKGSQLKTLFEYTFNECLSLKTIDMSACTQVNNIHHNAFTKCKSLQLCKIGTVIPPTILNGTFNLLPTSTLQVPAESVDAYKKAYGWKDFPHITSLD